ncbi:FAD-dependent monooxygenase [Pseudonocardia sp. WMMC193]|uniref:FAD-dependent monooxygenase n=1 Tax=Pseudonocardia sp. WMMC193 TaxID=2911965 RepID=UPI001F0157B7|nr:FAD-dependent monooxygenase [Pseudonocardia sp. WMMC193]MCF7547475.1 FAD-dependent monooxygenase [Pseudonocardia sp. WMMC193]
MTSTTPAVVIVGAGPTGLVTALGLAQRGISSEVLDAADDVAAGSRALGLSRRTLQIFDTLGVADTCLEKGAPWVGSRSFYRDTEVFRLELPDEPDEAFPAMLNLAQEDVTRILLEEIHKTVPDLVRIRWGCQVTAISSTADDVRVEIRTAAGRATARASWLVACDGARSTVREQLGVRLEGQSWDTRYVIVDVRLHSDHPAERRAWFDPPSNPGSTVLMHRQPADVWRLDYQIDGDPAADPDELVADVVGRVREHLDHIGEAGPFEVVWASTYQARALTAPRYRYGRVLLAGDAAHLIPIFGIRGLNSAVEDANNLAWKLAAVLDGRAGADLLETYSTERLAAARSNLALATRSTLFMAPPTPAHHLVRRALLGLVAEGHTHLRAVIDPRQTGTVGHPDSDLHAVPRAGAPATGPTVGEVFPDALVTAADGGSTHLSRHLGRAAALVCFGSPPSAVPAHHDLDVLTVLGAGAEAPVGVPGRVFVDPTGRAQERWQARPGDVVLVRPDGHVAGAWARPDDTELETALARLSPPESP